MKKPLSVHARSQRGVALLIALIAVFIVMALALGLMLLAGDESSAVGKQRSSSNALYAAQAGLEEARARMFFYHPNALAKAAPPVSLPWSVNQVVYIVNPAPGETVNPTNLSSSNPYADTEFQTEFPGVVPTATVVNSAQVNGAGLVQIPYKWARITLKTEQSAFADINGDGTIDNTTPVFFDGKRQNLVSSGDPVYRITALALAPGGKLHMVQADIAGITAGFKYAIASSGECEFETAGPVAISGSAICNGGIELQSSFSLTNGNLLAGSGTSGSGVINLGTGSGQVLSNTTVGNTVVGGSSPNVVSGPGTVPTLQTPSTPTPAPLAPNTMPNPDATALSAAVTAANINPPGTCVGGNIVFDLGNSTPPKVIEFTGASFTTACGTTISPANFPANVQFTGTGTLWFSNNSSMDIKFSNNFGTLTTPINLNIVVRPANNTVGSSEVEFAGTVNNIKGLVYVQGEIETEPKSPGGSGPGPSCSGVPSTTFMLSGSMMAYGTDSEIEAENCLVNYSVKYNAMQLSQINPPPGFNGLLVFGIAQAPVLNWHDVK